MIRLITNPGGNVETLRLQSSELPTAAPVVLVEGWAESFENSDQQLEASGKFSALHETISEGPFFNMLNEIEASDKLVGSWGAWCFVNMEPEELKSALPSLYARELSPSPEDDHYNEYYEAVTKYVIGDDLPDVDPRFLKLFTNTILLGIWASQATNLDPTLEISGGTYLDTVSEAIAMQFLASSNLGNFRTLTSIRTPFQLKYYALERLFPIPGVEKLTLAEGVDNVNNLLLSFDQFANLYIERFKELDTRSTSLVHELLQMVRARIMNLIDNGKASLESLPDSTILRDPVYQNVRDVDTSDFIKK